MNACLKNLLPIETSLLITFAFYAFYSSLGGRTIFGTPRLDE
jgi:hypothetical protein